MSVSKLAESSKAITTAHNETSNGQISLSDRAKTVWDLDPIFILHNLKNFLPKINWFKAEKEQYGGILKVPWIIFWCLIFIQSNLTFFFEQMDVFKNFSTKFEPHFKTRKVSFGMERRQMVLQEKNSTAYLGPASFQPLYLLPDCVQVETTSRPLTIVILPPSGVSVWCS